MEESGRSRKKAKEAATTFGNTGTHFYENPLVIALSLLFCFPVGLLLVWRHSLWTKSVKWAWTGGYVSFLLLVSVIRGPGARRIRSRLPKQMRLWQAGNKAAAVSKYLPLLSRLLTKEKSLPYGRLIDYEVERGNVEAARKLLEEAMNQDVYPSVNNPDAKLIQAKTEQEVNEIKVRENESLSARSGKSEAKVEETRGFGYRETRHGAKVKGWEAIFKYVEKERGRLEDDPSRKERDIFFNGYLEVANRFISIPFDAVKEQDDAKYMLKSV